MLVVYLFMKPIFWIVPWILQAIGYFFILKKMGLKKYAAIIPFFAEQQLESKLFKRKRWFWRAFLMAGIVMAIACYLEPHQGVGLMYTMVAFAAYEAFLIVLYVKLSNAFRCHWIFAILLIILPPVFLIVLGLGKKEFHQKQFKPDKERSKRVRIVRHIIFLTLTVLELMVIFGAAGYYAAMQREPAMLVKSTLSDVKEDTEGLHGTGKVVTREDTLGANADAQISSMETSRDHFFPDHSQDKSVVVMTYIVGSNLEDGNGLASANINQMLDATKKGSHLKFVIEAGGAGRWFTDGIENYSYGRYVIENGELTKVKDLPDDTSMSDADTLEDFISWAGKKYQADRNMLVLWDHGGGVAYGYGNDSVNKGDSAIQVVDIAKAIDNTGMKFDMIGFDACLMQGIEVEKALEPYADYFIGSEETESGYGWFYTTAFGKLAKNPGISTEEFGKELIACYDPYNKATSEGQESDVSATLSMVDLTLAGPAYDKLSDFLGDAAEQIKDDQSSYADLATAADSSFNFYENLQIDLIDFLKNLDKTDYDDSVCSHQDKKDMIKAVKASVVCRNGGSAEGIYGVALALPYKAIDKYGDTSDELKHLKLKNEKKAFDEIFSIIAYQNKSKNSGGGVLQNLVSALGSEGDYTSASWCMKEFKNYDDTEAYTDIPLTKVGKGDHYRIGLSKKAWKIITNSQTMVYQHTDDGNIDNVHNGAMRYIGSDYIGPDDIDSHPMVSLDGTWAYIGDQLVCYEAVPYKETKKGFIYSGKIRARLNGTDNIVLNVEWNPVKDGNAEPTVGKITGYDYENDEDTMKSKGENDLKAGDTLQFRFDYYDADGNFIKTKAVGDKVHVSKQDRLEVEYKDFEPCTISFGGNLTDVYQRNMTTELITKEIK